MPNQPRTTTKKPTRSQRKRHNRAKKNRQRFESIDVLQEDTGLSLEESLAVSLNRKPLDPL